MIKGIKLLSELALHLISEVILHIIVVKTSQRSHIVHVNGSLILENGWNDNIVDMRLLLSICETIQCLSEHVYIL